MTDKNLAIASQAFSQVMKEQGWLIHSVCRSRLGPGLAHAVEDAAAETALKLYRVMERQVRSGEDVHCNRSFVRLVATRTAITMVNQHLNESKRRRRLVHEVAVTGQLARRSVAAGCTEHVQISDLDAAELSFLLAELPQLIAQLRERDRTLLRLYYLSSPSLPWSAIGERLQMRASAARQAGRRALCKLSALVRASLDRMRGEPA